MNERAWQLVGVIAGGCVALAGAAFVKPEYILGLIWATLCCFIGQMVGGWLALKRNERPDA